MKEIKMSAANSAAQGNVASLKHWWIFDKYAFHPFMILEYDSEKKKSFFTGFKRLPAIYFNTNHHFLSVLVLF